MTWTVKETQFLIDYYPSKGKVYCARQLNKSLASIRQKTSNMGLYQDKNSEFFKDWQSRAAKSKVGKKRPDQALVTKRTHDLGKLKKTDVQRNAATSRLKKWLDNNPHPKGMLGKTHSEEFKKTQSVRSKKNWENMDEQKKLMRSKKIMTTRIKNGSYSPLRKNCTWKSGWREIGSVRKYYRSKWEANYARYLEWLKSIGEIKEWSHEPDVFWFEGIKRGCVSYLPDFKVVNINDSFEYHEVKGWMDDRSKTKINRMRKYHPQVKLIVICQKEYNGIKDKVSKLIKGWE